MKKVAGRLPYGRSEYIALSSVRILVDPNSDGNVIIYCHNKTCQSTLACKILKILDSLSLKYVHYPKSNTIVWNEKKIIFVQWNNGNPKKKHGVKAKEYLHIIDDPIYEMYRKKHRSEQWLKTYQDM